MSSRHSFTVTLKIREIHSFTGTYDFWHFSFLNICIILFIFFLCRLRTGNRDFSVRLKSKIYSYLIFEISSLCMAFGRHYYERVARNICFKGITPFKHHEMKTNMYFLKKIVNRVFGTRLIRLHRATVTTFTQINISRWKPSWL